MNHIELPGLKPQPLLNYLAGHGLIRILGQQRPEWRTRAWWQGGLNLQLHDANFDDLTEFLVHDYAPSPIMSPWNGRASLAASKGGQYQNNLQSIRQSDQPRYHEFGEAIDALTSAWAEGDRRGLIGADGKVSTKGDDKQRFLRLLRATAPDSVVAWIDASIVLLDDSVSYPLIVGGTGGNIGSGDLSDNYAAMCTRLLPPDPNAKTPRGVDPAGMLHDALCDTSTAQLTADTAHHFDLGSTSGSKLSNPWLFLLAMEGALTFASSAARRYGADVRTARAHAAVPYTVYPTSIGYASASDNEEAKGEFWAPIWSSPKTPSAVHAMMAEGRIQWSGSQAQTGLDVVRALAAQGADRSIQSFVRYVFAVRNGQNVVAVPAGTYGVRANDHVQLLRSIDSWLRFVPTRLTSDDVVTARRQVLHSQFNYATHQRPDDLADVLAALFDIERAAAQSPKSRESIRRPISGLKAHDWVAAMSDLYTQHPEFRLAMSWASQRDTPQSPVNAGHQQAASSLRTILRPITRTTQHRLEFTANAKIPVSGLGYRPLEAVLSDALIYRTRFAAGRHISPRRVTVRSDHSTPDGPTSILGTVPDLPGVAAAFDLGISVPLGDLSTFLAGRLDEQRLEHYLKALLMLESWTEVPLRSLKRHHHQASYPANAFDPLWGLMAPFFHRDTIQTLPPISARVTARTLDTTERRLPALRARSQWATLLTAGHTERVASLVLTSYRSVGFSSPAHPATVASPYGKRVAAALLAPVSLRDLGSVRRAMCPQTDDYRSDAPRERPMEQSTTPSTTNSLEIEGAPTT